MASIFCTFLLQRDLVELRLDWRCGFRPCAVALWRERWAVAAAAAATIRTVLLTATLIITAASLCSHSSSLVKLA